MSAAIGYPDPYAPGSSGGTSSEPEVNLFMLAIEIVAVAGKQGAIERVIDDGWRALVDGAMIEAGDEGRRAAYGALRLVERHFRQLWGREAVPEATESA